MESSVKIRDYHVISDKIVRKKEKYIEIYYTKNDGVLKKTNRGYFLDGRNISCTSAEKWRNSVDITNRKVFDHDKRIV